MLVLMLLPMVMAETDTFSTSRTTNNGTTWRNQIFVYYLSDFYNFVNPPMNFYTKYWCDNSIQDWNDAYPNHQISNITMQMVYSERKVGVDGIFGNYTQYTTSVNISDMTMPFHDYYKFFSLYQKESEIIYIDTNYKNSSNLVRDSPCGFGTYVATKGCNRCQEYDFRQFEQDKAQADTINTYTDATKLKIQTFFGWQWEFALIIFWAMRIAIILFVISIVLWIVMWLVHWMRHFFGQ